MSSGVAAFKPLSPGLTRIWVQIAGQKDVKLQFNVCCRDWHAKLAHTSLGKSVGERHIGFQVDSL